MTFSEDKMDSMAIQPWGNYALALGTSIECLGVLPWTQTSSTPETLSLGVEASPEFSCLSFKASTGHFIKAAKEGVRYGVMVNSRGTCRLRYYRDLQQQILRRHGMELYIFSIGYDGWKPPMIRYFDPPLMPVIRAGARARAKVLTIDLLEENAWHARARETTPGATSRTLEECLRELDQARTVKEIQTIKKRIPKRFAEIPVDKQKRPLKIGLLGESSVLRDKYLNHNLEEVLGTMGVEVRNFFLLGAEIRKIFNISFFSRHSRKNLRRIARPYLHNTVGGHALESVAYSILCAREGYDGVIHVAPAGCMPEVSVRPILRKVSRDFDLPLLECSFDEHASHLGVVTRLEAFVDVLQGRRKKKTS